MHSSQKRTWHTLKSEKPNLTSHSGLSLIGQCCQAAQVDLVIDPKFPVSQGMRTSDCGEVHDWTVESGQE